MSSHPLYVAVEWGTSSFRLWLVGKDGSVLAERRSGEGMTTAAKTGFAAVLDGHLDAVSAARDLPVIVCGMAGARQGWVEAGYLDTPAALSAIPDAAVRVPADGRDIRILPGLAQRDPSAPDVMRGEETQLLGAMETLGSGRHLVCMPGTHSKWVSVAAGRVAAFATFMTGELFEAIATQTILSHSVSVGGGRGKRPAGAADQSAFCAGNLLHGLGAVEAKARLSGLMIGIEIAGALSMVDGDASVALVASGPLGDLYRSAFTAVGIEAADIDADEAVRAGLATAAKALWPN